MAIGIMYCMLLKKESATDKMNECQVIWLDLQDLEKEASRWPIFVNFCTNLTWNIIFRKITRKQKQMLGSAKQCGGLGGTVPLSPCLISNCFSKWLLITSKPSIFVLFLLTYISYFFGSIFILPCVESWIVWELCSSLFPRHICLSFYLLSYILYLKFLSCLISNCLSKWILITSMPFTFTFFCVEDLDRIAIRT